jgi:hypothetical protein
MKRFLLILALAAPLLARAQGTVLVIGGRHRAETGPATNAWTPRLGVARVYTITAYNSSATDLYLHVFDAAATPANNTVPALAPVLVPAGKTAGHDYHGGAAFTNGVTICTSTTDRTLTNSTASFMLSITFNDRAQ